MTDVATTELPQVVVDAAADVLPLLRHYDTGRFALTVAGSTSKGTADSLSDIDFRFYSDKRRPKPDASWDREWDRLFDRWKARGVVLDELWFRTVEDIDNTIDRWLSGTVVPDEMLWTVWGYYPLTDFSRQLAVVDPDDLVAGWRARLEPYPDAVRHATIKRHIAPLRYWRGDYHYANKATRGDAVFLAGLSADLVHHLIQVLCAINRAYFPGDGNNLIIASQFESLPVDFADRVTAALYPTAGYEKQREILVELVDDVETLLSQAFPNEEWAR